MLQVAQNIFKNVSSNVRVLLVAGDLVCLQIRNRELRLVVQHLFEVRDEPVLIDRVAMKSAAELIVHPALGHRTQSHKNHVSSFFVAITQQKIEHARPRELGRGAESAQARVERSAERKESGIERVLPDLAPIFAALL